MPDLDHIISHPEVQTIVEETLPILINESDRGAVLVGLSVIDEQLYQLFDKLVPQNIGRKKKKEILDYNGFAGTLSSKLNTALVCRLLPIYLIEAVHTLRKIRNRLAHAPSSFSLEENKQDIEYIYDQLGENINSGLSQLALQFVREMMIDELMKSGRPVHPFDLSKGKFANQGEAIAYIQSDKNLTKIYDLVEPKYKFAYGIALMCGLIISHRELLIDLLGGDRMISALKLGE
ncbi:hypothetical protein [Emcibacter sp.]|uniref:hypothetical protein n=1 Tax=Emcibacter sp. TaxID=1979954 RepID=UPI002AA8BCF4|nr:hypothetical protein [Emcibacter sp.]